VRSLTDGDHIEMPGGRGHEERRPPGGADRSGPHVMGELIKARLLDEAFLTISPVLAGRDQDSASEW